jgi:hypothetical protein
VTYKSEVVAAFRYEESIPPKQHWYQEVGMCLIHFVTSKEMPRTFFQRCFFSRRESHLLDDDIPGFFRVISPDTSLPDPQKCSFKGNVFPTRNEMVSQTDQARRLFFQSNREAG